MKRIHKNMEKDTFSQIIRNKLENYSLPIQESSWKELEKGLKEAESKKKMGLWPWISGISVAASVALAVLFSYHKKELDHDDTTRLSYHAEKIAENVPAEENLSLASHTRIQVRPARQQDNPEIPNPEKSVVYKPDIILPDETSENNTESSTTKEIDASKNRSNNPGPRLEIWGEPELISYEKQKNKSKSIALHISSGGRLYAANNPLNVTGHADYSELRYSNISKNAPSLLNEDMFTPADFSQITHQPPFSVGLSIQKTLTGYFSVESGLTYTYLYSSFKNNAPRRDASLALHYLGIPVNLTANLYPSTRNSWSIYISAGGMVEKGLLSHYVQHTYSTESSVITTSNEPIDGLQWSIQAAIGFSYQFNRNYSIFLEPKMSYYLDNNQPFNARTEHPFVPGVNIGLRHTW